MAKRLHVLLESVVQVPVNFVVIFLSVTSKNYFCRGLTTQTVFYCLSMLNKQLQGVDKPLADAKIFDFIAFLQLCQKNASAKNTDKLYWLNKCELTDAAVSLTADQLSKMTTIEVTYFLILKKLMSHLG